MYSWWISVDNYVREATVLIHWIQNGVLRILIKLKGIPFILINQSLLRCKDEYVVHITINLSIWYCNGKLLLWENVKGVLKVDFINGVVVHQIYKEFIIFVIEDVHGNPVWAILWWKLLLVIFILIKQIVKL